MGYNAEHRLCNGHAVFGYVGSQGKPYEVDPKAGSAVQRMFADYASDTSMQEICDEPSAAGFRTVRGNKFGVKTLNRMLKNR